MDNIKNQIPDLDNERDPVPYLVNIREHIKLTDIPEADHFQCPHCFEVGEYGVGRIHGDSCKVFHGPIEQRHDDAGYDWVEVLKCPNTGNFYWYLNGV